jgi:release factor glutamine methyltransferase
MKTVKDAFEIFKQELVNLYDSYEANAITALAISDLTKLSKAKLKAFPETIFTEEQSARLSEILEKLKTGQPVQYILGHTEFYGLPFVVNSSVLIPRPETEELVSWIIDSNNNESLKILDIGTGSGCIAIALKSQLRNAEVNAIDVSEGALNTARRNAKINNTDINFIHADILSPARLNFNPKLNVIVSNPPYVTLTDKAQMHSNVTDFEPHTALFVPEDDPLIFYKAIADFALQNLKPDGLLFFEINESLGKETMEMLGDKSFENIELKQDIRGKDRMIKAQLRG